MFMHVQLVEISCAIEVYKSIRRSGRGTNKRSIAVTMHRLVLKHHVQYYIVQVAKVGRMYFVVTPFFKMATITEVYILALEAHPIATTASNSMAVTLFSVPSRHDNLSLPTHASICVRGLHFVLCAPATTVIVCKAVTSRSSDADERCIENILEATGQCRVVVGHLIPTYLVQWTEWPKLNPFE